ncbi:MAG TPA: carbohydrate porin [Stellaceae bacterium]|jgi:porin
MWSSRGPLLVFATLLLCTAARADDVSPSNPPNSPDDDEQHHLFANWGGLRDRLKEWGIKLDLVEQSEVWGDLAGGRRQGAVYDGLTIADVKLNLDKMIGWTGGWVYASAFNIHGRGPSGNLAGNMQLVSNVEATRDTKLYDLWFAQHLWDDKLDIRFGQEGANDEMMTSQYAGLFLNSSFGFPGLPAADLPSGGPNYPMATPFARVKVQASDALTLVGAVFNGDPAPPGTGDPQLRDAGGTAFRLNDHTLGVGEVWYSVGQGKGELPGTYKLGAWYSSFPFADQRFDTNGVSLASPLSNGRPLMHSGGYAIYGIVDQMVWQPPDACDGCGIGLFAQVMGAPSRFNLSDLFVEGGLNWKGVFKGRDNDTLGLGVSYVGISPAAQAFSGDVIAFAGTGTRYAGNETVIELTYAYKATLWLALQPDLQYVINPNAGIPTASSPVPLKNALVAGMHVTVLF